MKQRSGRSHRRHGHGRHRAQGRSASADRHRGRQEARPLASYSIPAGAHVVVERRQEDRQAGTLLAKTPRKSREDQGHHRRSAACGRTLRSAPSERRCGDRQDRRRRRYRRHRSRQAQDHRQRSADRRRGGAPHAARQAHHRLQGRLREERPAAHRRSGACRTKSSMSAGRRSCRSTWSTKCRKFIASRAWRSTTSTSRSSSARCCAR